MKKYLLIITSFLAILSSNAYAEKTLYEIRADGLACAYCAYGIEKKFKAIDGVSEVDVELKQGLVKVTTEKGVSFNDTQLTTLFNDAGFTYKGISKTTEIE